MRRLLPQFGAASSCTLQSLAEMLRAKTSNVRPTGGEKVALKGLCVIDKLSTGGGKSFLCK